MAAIIEGVGGFTTVQAAIHALNRSRGTVEVCPGQWHENLVINGPTTLMASEGPARTRIVGDGTGSVITINSNEAYLDGLAITGGVAVGTDGSELTGGGISFTFLGGTAAIRNCLVVGNRADRGGGLYAFGSGALVIEDTLFLGNQATDDGGNVFLQRLDVTLDHVLIVQGDAEYGGNLAARNSVVTAGDGVALVGGTATWGGGLHANSGRWSGGVIALNHATVGGGALISGGAELVGADVYNNTGDGGGGGIYCSRDCSITGSEIHDNRATDGSGGGLIFDSANSSVLVSSTAIHDNRAPKGAGGGVAFGPRGSALFEDSTISDNQAAGGGGISTGSVVQTHGLVVSGNEATVRGGGLYLGGDARVGGADGDEMEITGNRAPVGGGVALYLGGALHDALVADNTATETGGGVAASQSHGRLRKVTGNQATVCGGGLWVVGGLMTVLDTRLDMNASAIGGGIGLDQGMLLLSGVDLGTGKAANAPDDFALCDGSASYTGLGEGLNLFCDGSGCLFGDSGGDTGG
ncbi:MAG: hypothetical protein GXP62_20930 [Oligoflexia bacterium]|nr:hypothetical protein [Oligoflexia bacterium]